MLTWIRRRFWLGLAALVLGAFVLGGWALAGATERIGDAHIVPGPTITSTKVDVRLKTRRITVQVPGKVIRRVDHILVVQTPRYVFIYRGKRRVIPPHVVRIRYSPPTGLGSSSPVGAVLGVGPTAVTVTVPVTVPVQGPTSTVISVKTETETIPPITSTITSVTTVTVPLGGEARGGH